MPDPAAFGRHRELLVCIPPDPPVDQFRENLAASPPTLPSQPRRHPRRGFWYLAPIYATVLGCLLRKFRARDRGSAASLPSPSSFACPRLSVRLRRGPPSSPPSPKQPSPAVHPARWGSSGRAGKTESTASVESRLGILTSRGLRAVALRGCKRVLLGSRSLRRSELAFGPDGV
jgi:hypothetical protein